MKQDQASQGRTGAPWLWVDVIGRNPAQLTRIQEELALPPRLVALSLVEHLRPGIVRVSPGRFIVTQLTLPSPRNVFVRRPLYIWVAGRAAVTISPWDRRPVVEATRIVQAPPRAFLSRVVEAAVHSHEEVSRHLSEAFFADDCAESERLCQRKQRRLTTFGRLLEEQRGLVRVLGKSAQAHQLWEQLSALVRIVQYAERRLRESGCCRTCTRPAGGERCGPMLMRSTGLRDLL